MAANYHLNQEWAINFPMGSHEKLGLSLDKLSSFLLKINVTSL